MTDKIIVDKRCVDMANFLIKEALDNKKVVNAKYSFARHQDILRRSSLAVLNQRVIDKLNEVGVAVEVNEDSVTLSYSNKNGVAKTHTPKLCGKGQGLVESQAVASKKLVLSLQKEIATPWRSEYSKEELEIQLSIAKECYSLGGGDKKAISKEFQDLKKQKAVERKNAANADILDAKKHFEDLAREKRQNQFKLEDDYRKKLINGVSRSDLLRELAEKVHGTVQGYPYAHVSLRLYPFDARVFVNDNGDAVVHKNANIAHAILNHYDASCKKEGVVLTAEERLSFDDFVSDRNDIEKESVFWANQKSRFESSSDALRQTLGRSSDDGYELLWKPSKYYKNFAVRVMFLEKNNISAKVYSTGNKEMTDAIGSLISQELHAFLSCQGVEFSIYLHLPSYKFDLKKRLAQYEYMYGGTTKLDEKDTMPCPAVEAKVEGGTKEVFEKEIDAEPNKGIQEKGGLKDDSRKDLKGFIIATKRPRSATTFEKERDESRSFKPKVYATIEDAKEMLVNGDKFYFGHVSGRNGCRDIDGLAVERRCSVITHHKNRSATESVVYSISCVLPASVNLASIKTDAGLRKAYNAFMATKPEEAIGEENTAKKEIESVSGVVITLACVNVKNDALVNHVGGGIAMKVKNEFYPLPDSKKKEHFVDNTIVLPWVTVRGVIPKWGKNASGLE